MIGTTFNRLCKLIFAIFALLLLPSTTWAARYSTCEYVKRQQVMSSIPKYSWKINNNDSWNWNIEKSSNNTDITNDNQSITNFVAEFKVDNTATVTLTATNAVSDQGRLRKVILNGLSTTGDCSIAVKLGDYPLTSGSDGVYNLDLDSPDSPETWGTITITIQGNAGATCNINSIDILTGTDDSGTSFAFPENVSSITNNYITFNSTKGTFSVVYDTNVAESKTLTYLLQPSEGRTIKYASSDTSIATVDENTGVVTLTGTEGETFISATPEENDNYYYSQNASKSYTINVYQSYGFTIADTPVSSNNASNVFGDGTVSFATADNKLTLNNAIISGPVKWENNAALTINLIGENQIGDYNDYALESTSSVDLNFTKGDNNSTQLVLLHGDTSKGIGTMNQFSPKFPNNDLYIVGKGEYGLAVTSEKPYPITVNGITVHNVEGVYGYKEFILEHLFLDPENYNKTLTYDNSTNTLTMNGVSLNGGIYWTGSSDNDLTIEFSGTNSIAISGSSDPAIGSKNQSKLTIAMKSDATNTSTLTLSSYYEDNSSIVNVNPIIQGFSSVSAPGLTASLATQDNIDYTTYSIPPISVAGYNPDEDGNITGDGITGTVKYTGASAIYDSGVSSTWPTLTLTGANISGGIEWNPIDGKNLLIVINGKNTIENSDNRPAISTEKSGVSLEIKGSDSGDASLKMRDSYNGSQYYAISGFSNSSNTETLLDGLYQLKLSSPNGVVSDIRDNYTYISNNSGYETYMTIGYYTVHNIPDEPGYMENVFGDDGTPTVEFEKTDDGGVLTLNNASIKGNVRSAIDHLKVYLIGSSNMTEIDNSSKRAFSYSGEGTAASLTFDSTDEDAGQITFHNIHEFVAIAQGYSITPNLLSVPSADGWAKQEYYDSEKQSEQCVVLLKDISYNVSVNGVPVTKSNANNIDGTGIVFTPADETEGTPATLTLNEANFTTSGQNAFESGLANLTVLLEGENIITCGGNSDKLFKGTVSGAKVTFAVGNTSEGRLGGQCLEANMFDGITPVYPEELIYTRSGDSYLIADVRVDLSGEFYGNNNYATFCEEQSDVYPKSDITPFVVTGVSGSSVTLQALSYIPKGVPVILGKTKNTATSASFSVNKLQSAGYEGDEVTASSAKPLYVLYNDQFVKVTDNTAIHRGRCYLELSASAGTRDSYSINAINGTSAIEGVKSEGVESEKYDDWFDLQGRRIDKPTAKGLYIQSGKKVVIR